jgi:hypothetical protein
MKFVSRAANTVLAFAAALTVASAHSSVGSGGSLIPYKICGNTCRFTFCPRVKDYLFPVGKSDKAVTPSICDATGKINVGHVDSTGEASVYNIKTGPVKISSYSPPGLLQKFSPSFFKSFSLNSFGSDLSGVGHEVPQQNQVEYLDNICIILPLTAYQILNKPGGVVIDNIHPAGTETIDCVAFSTSRSKVVNP